MKISRALLCLFLLLPAVAVFGGIAVDHDKEADFSKYQTYSIEEATAAVNPLMRPRLIAAIENALVAKGLKKADGGGDLKVVIHTSVDTEQQITADSWGYGGYPGWRGWRGWGSTTVDVSNSKVGPLIPDLVDAESGRLVWRGVDTDSLPQKPEKVEKRINKAVEKLFRHFPPEEV